MAYQEMARLCHGVLHTVLCIREMKKHLLEGIKSSEQDSTLFRIGERGVFTSPFTGCGFAA